MATFVLSLGFIASAASAQSPTVDGPLPAPLVPTSNWWSTNISKAPLDPKSAAFIKFINNGGSRRLHPDWGGSANQASDPQRIYGLPYVVVPGTQPLVPVTFRYAGESDAGAPGRPPGYPIPEQVKTQAGWMEGGAPAGSTSSLPSAKGDRHLLIVDRDRKILYELFSVKWNTSSRRWEAGSGAVFPLTTNHRRPAGWTSADAAGLAILPGLVRYDEALLGTQPIRHAFRMTVRATNGYVYPASHRAGSTTGALPMGARLRLKASVDITRYPTQVRRVLQAMKTYGLIVADNGSDMFITGSSDPRWQAQMSTFISTFHAMNASMFDVVKLGWKPTAAAATTLDTLTTDAADANETGSSEVPSTEVQSIEAQSIEAQSIETQSNEIETQSIEGASIEAHSIETSAADTPPGPQPSNPIDPIEARYQLPDGTTLSRWTFRNGEVGGPSGAETSIQIANPSLEDREVRVTFLFEDGTRTEETYVVAADGSLTVSASDFIEAADRRFTTIVEATGTPPTPIVVDRVTRD